MKNKVLLVNQDKGQCGVYQFGKNTASCLLQSDRFTYLETDSSEVFESRLTEDIEAVIFNHHPCTMNWLTAEILAKYPRIKFAIIMHDECIDIPGIHAILHPDPTFTRDGKHFKVGRPILYNKSAKLVLPNTIGSFGFGFDHKGFPELVERVNSEFDEATIRMHIPLNTKVDESGQYAFGMHKKLKMVPKKPGISLEISHEYKTEQELIEWLSSNSINVFLYRNTGNLSKGCSSTVDWAIAAKRPLAFTNDPMFRHVYAHAPECCIENNSLKAIIEMGIEPLNYFYENWTVKNLIAEYEEIINEMLRS